MLLSSGTDLHAAYPDRAIKWVVPYAAGGGADVIARLVANAMSATLRQPIVIENRPGASTNLAADSVAKAEADGYTLLSADNGTLVNNRALFAKLPFDSDQDLLPIGLLARFQLVLTASTKSAINSASEFVMRARAAPDALNFGSPGVGSPHHLAMARLMKETGLRLTHVPYRGVAPLSTDLLSGNVESAIIDFAAGSQLMRGGQIRALAVCSKNRLPTLPDIPTIEEALGVPKFEAFAWQGLMTTGRTQKTIAAVLASAHQTAIADPTVRARMNDLGVEPLSGGPGEFASLIQSERAIWVPLIKELSLTLD